MWDINWTSEFIPNGKSFNYIPLPSACFGIGIDLPTKSKVRFETSYRFKKHGGQLAQERITPEALIGMRL
jgi:hypothetical protein